MIFTSRTAQGSSSGTSWACAADTLITENSENSTQLSRRENNQKTDTLQLVFLFF